MIDTHTHLCDPIFNIDRAIVLAKARQAGVTHIISVSETLADVQFNLKLAEIHPELFPAAGLYPANLDLEEAERIGALIEKNVEKLVAIGEVGLDYWVVKEEEGREIQREIFRTFIDLSLEMDLPLNIHSRSAGKIVIQMLLEKGAQAVHLHAFDGKASSALPAVEAGYYFSIPPSIVRSTQKQKLVRQLPLSALLLETDSPVLGVDPDARNEPANLSIALDAIAEIKNCAMGEVLEAVTENTLKLYPQLKTDDNY
ncbi:MAG: TatD family hydrolase [Deltaproteobacteria bacterium]|jgi:TatD DNase family protein|nr:TatD family hydrolase [Deltaproteobacteria bacterium]MBT4637774.1 TatD family hydrolase [Deltaproteobacteria bacterium]MBT6501180.1 TatD family hydrolase [Deltaproteobacteria bacterium]MBT6611373.1 TatD family hydrolase [Deltaproteobacteria bacterium]MBT7151474.1 TatD family hydrolase [Deltaproteobacteria bacterium]